MKYFTKEWCSSKLEDQEIEENVKKYETYINEIQKNLPFTLKMLTKSINLHDGIIKKVSYSSEGNSLSIEGIFGDLQVGYFILELLYSNVSKLEKDVLSSVFKGQKLEVLSDEIELISKNLHAHRILFSTNKEIEITFSDMKIKINNSSSENYKKEPCTLMVK